jgi:hypothetical protein
MASSARVRINVAELPVDDLAVLERALPAPLVAFAAPIVRSRAMLELEDDWDGEGSPGYAESTWRRVVAFLLDNALALSEDFGAAPPAPKIRKGPHGSIDIHWQLPNRILFVNVPVDTGETAEFFGHDGVRGSDGRFEHTVQGSLDVADEHPWLLMWLTQT